ncbi:MAG: helix-turn-helix domain-containing protein, partial [Candidatus Omnitrophota bacterium]
DDEKVKEIITRMLKEIGNTKIDILKEEGMVRIVRKEDIKDMVSLEDKVIELEDNLFAQNRGSLYKAIVERIEKPVIEHILERTEGNQLKAARILGINRNTMRAKVRKLGINCAMYKQ